MTDSLKLVKASVFEWCDVHYLLVIFIFFFFFFPFVSFVISLSVGGGKPLYGLPVLCTRVLSILRSKFDIDLPAVFAICLQIVPVFFCISGLI